MQDVRWAARTLRKQAGFTVLALVTLALGIGATTAAFTVLDTVLLRPLPYRDPGQLVLIRERTANRRLLPPSYPNFDDWRTLARSFSGVVSMMFPQSGTVSSDGLARRATLMGVSRDFFQVLGVTPVVGRTFTAQENQPGGPPLVMVSHDFWQTALGGRRPLGSIRMGDRSLEVVGVLPAGFRFGGPADLYFPHEQGPGTVRSAHNYMVVGRLAPGLSLGQARAEMTTLSRDLLAQYGDATQAADADVTPLREYLVGDSRTLLLIVFGAAGLVLLIACTNLVSAQLARGLWRERELTVRAALGAGRRRIVRQLFVESAVLALAGAALGTGLASFLVRLIRLLGTGLVPRLNELHLDGGVLLFVAGATVLTSLIIGLYPALRLADRDPGRILRTAGRSGGPPARALVWRLLIGFEVGLAVMLLVGSGLLVHTLYNILTADTGLDPHGVVTAELSPDGRTPAALDQLQAELAAVPGVAGVAYATQLPFQWGDYSAPVLRPGDSPDHDWPALAGFRVISANYFQVLRQPILRGRSFTAADRADAPPVAIITPGIAARLWPGADPIGKRIASNFTGSDLWYTVVGVVEEASSWSMPHGSQNEVFVPLAQQPGQARAQLVAFLRARRDARDLIPAVRQRLHTLAPDLPAEFGTLEDRISHSAADRWFAMFALVAFGAIALALAGIGIYGVMSYTVMTRHYEIGVRMALGATPATVRWQMLRNAAGMAAGGVALGALGAEVVTRFLQSALYEVTRLDPITYAAGVALLGGAALLGAYIPARRSSRVDPVVAIRGEP